MIALRKHVGFATFLAGAIVAITLAIVSVVALGAPTDRFFFRVLRFSETTVLGGLAYALIWSHLLRRSWRGPFLFTVGCMVVVLLVGYSIEIWQMVEAANARPPPRSATHIYMFFIFAWPLFLGLGSVTGLLAWLIRRPDRDAANPTSDAP